ncbi:MAG: SDR family NAD(P)-dependent oxidoreductase [Alteromonadaceae bacterium]|nr:SDR family NAD(P)-dependent oxidoreductase [Alteromonadaceae bacterium]
MKLANQVAIVTGGASGIGLAITEMLLQQGVNVAISSRREQLIKQTATELNNRYEAKVIAVAGDVRQKQDMQRLVEETVGAFGKVDILVNNSGLGVSDKVIDCPEENWDLVLETCTKGTFLLSQAVLPHMQKQRSGFIINIASQAAKNGYAQAAPYCAAKFGVLGFGLALQEEVREFGIKVHSLCPGLVQVPAVKSESEFESGWLQPEDLAQSVLFLLSQPKRVHFDNIGMWGMPV